MTRLTLALAIGGVLFAAMALGWVGHWLWSRSRLNSDTHRTRQRFAELTASLHAAEAARDAADRRAADIEAAKQTSAEAAEAELLARLAERQAELNAAMETLRHARQEADEWRKAYDAVSAKVEAS